MEVDPKSMSLDALIASDKGKKTGGANGGNRGGRGDRGGDRRGRGGFRERGGRGGSRDQKPNNRQDNFRARKTGNMISKQKDERMTNVNERRVTGGNFKVSNY
jgi:hypothetical protein